DLTDPTVVPSVIPELGSAMQFLSGDYLFPGSNVSTPAGALDLSGDFTIQYWAAFPDGYNFTFGQAYAAIDSAAASGFATTGAYTGVGSAGELEAFVGHGVGDENQFPVLTGTLPDTGWHHFRVVRDTSAGELRLCRDGARVMQGTLPGNLNTT